MVSKSRPYTGHELTLTFRIRGKTSRSSLGSLTKCQGSLPPLSDLTILPSGGSSTDQELLQSSLDSLTSTVGEPGQLLWKPSSRSPIMLSIAIRLGRNEALIVRSLVQKNKVLDFSLSRSRTRSRGSSPQNRVQTSGASKICSTTSLKDVELLGLTRLFAFAISQSISNWRGVLPRTADWLLLTCQQLAIGFLRTLLDRYSGVTTGYFDPSVQHGPVVSGRLSAQERLRSSG